MSLTANVHSLRWARRCLREHSQRPRLQDERVGWIMSFYQNEDQKCSQNWPVNFEFCPHAKIKLFRILSLQKLIDASRLFFSCFWFIHDAFLFTVMELRDYLTAYQWIRCELTWLLRSVCVGVCVCTRPGVGSVFPECLREYLRISSARLCIKARKKPCGGCSPQRRVCDSMWQRLSLSLNPDFNAQNARKRNVIWPLLKRCPP